MNKLTGAQEVAAAMLAEGISITHIAKELGIHYKTISLWMQHELFSNRVNSNKEQLAGIINKAMVETVEQMLNRLIPIMIERAAMVATDDEIDVNIQLKGNNLVRQWQGSLFPRSTAPVNSLESKSEIADLMAKFKGQNDD